MVQVFVERRFDPALTEDEIEQGTGSRAVCSERGTVLWRESLLDRSGARLLCRFEAPSKSAVERALGGRSSRTVGLWTGTIHPIDWPPASERGNGSSPVAAERRLSAGSSGIGPLGLQRFCAWCFETHRVRLVRVLVADDLERAIYLYLAPDAESVRIAHRQAGFDPGAVWPYREIVGYPRRGQLPRSGRS